MRLRALFFALVVLASSVATAQDAQVYRRRAGTSVAPTTQWLFGSGGGTAIGSGVTNYYPLTGFTQIDTHPTTAGSRIASFPAGTLNNLWAQTNTDGTNDIGDGATVTFTVYKNGSSTGLTCTITASAGQPPYDHFCASTPIVSSVSFSDGDYAEMQIVTTGTIRAGTIPKWAVLFDPDTDNQYVYTSGVERAANPGAGIGRWKGLGWYNDNVSTTEAQSQWVVPIAGTFTRMMIRHDAATTAGEFRTFLNKNGSETAMNCVMASGSTCSVTTDIAVAAGDTFSLSSQTPGASICTAADVPFDCCTGAGAGATCSTAHAPSTGQTAATLLFTPTTRGRYWMSSSGNTGLNNAAARYGGLLGPRAFGTTQFSEFSMPFAELKVSGNPLLVLHNLYVRSSLQPTAGQSWLIDLWETPTKDSGTPTTASAASCTIDETCSSAPCTCTDDLSSVTINSAADGPSLYETRVTPTGTPTVPTMQIAIEVSQP